MRSAALLLVLVATFPVAEGSRRRNSNNNDCPKSAYCGQWRNLSADPYAHWSADKRKWECQYGQMAVGRPDTVEQDQYGYDRVVKSPEYDYNPVTVSPENSCAPSTECHSQTPYKCGCVSEDDAYNGNMAQRSWMMLLAMVSWCCCFPIMLCGSIGVKTGCIKSGGGGGDMNMGGGYGMQPGFSNGQAGMMAQPPPGMQQAYAMPVPNVQPGTKVVIVVPQGVTPGMQIMVDPDGPEGPLPPVAVTVPAGAVPGQQIEVLVPAAAPVVAVAAPVAAVPAAAPVVAVAAPVAAVAVAQPAVAVAQPAVAVAQAVTVKVDNPLNLGERVQGGGGEKDPPAIMLILPPAGACAAGLFFMVMYYAFAPSKDEYWTGCRGTVGGAASTMASLALVVVCVVAAQLFSH